MNVEILAPAGGEETARIAASCGADAIYLGLDRFSARSAAENFGLDALKRTAEFCHLLGTKVYVCLNTLVKDCEVEAFFGCAKEAYMCGADAILIQDIFLGRALKRRFPEITLHLSTQAGCCNEWGAKLAKECGFSRVVLARETPIPEIKKISKILETEVFVQGALCASFSGQCYFSSFAGNNSGNRGRCKQPCRKKYSIDRKGFEEFAYALSPCDLALKTRVKELVDAGAVSLKIEGRLRGSEYAAAAIKYYRAALGGQEAEKSFSDLMRAYNRGDYTFGLGFGQKNFLSRKVQGHIGEKIGSLQADGFCKSDHIPDPKDGFKILRGGKEVCGAVFDQAKKARAGGFYLAANEKLKAGDEVRLTKDASLPQRVLCEKKRGVTLDIRIVPNELAKIAAGGFVYFGEPFEKAQKSPLSEEELTACFEKTDGLPFSVHFQNIELENVFAPKSLLNKLRRDFFEAYKNSLLPERPPLTELPVPSFPSREKADSRKTAIISNKAEAGADILIVKPDDYADIPDVKGFAGEKYLYLPAFFTGDDLALVEPSLKNFDGIYCEGSFGLLLAREKGLKYFAGTGNNLTNRVAVEGALSLGAAYFALSKEISAKEQDELSFSGAFVLKAGAIKVMDLCFCPFERTCKGCDKRGTYRLTDEAGRRFPLRRYRASDEFCRFEVYNCMPLSGGGTEAGALIDKSVVLDTPPTGGHTKRSML